jgi:hypothetical protein
LIVAVSAHTLFSGNDETRSLTDSHVMTPHPLFAPEVNAPPWLPRLLMQLHRARDDFERHSRLPLLRLAAAVLLALLALGTAGGLIATP